MYSQTPFKSNILHKLHLVQWTWIHLLIYLDTFTRLISHTFKENFSWENRQTSGNTTMCTTTICFNAFLE